MGLCVCSSACVLSLSLFGTRTANLLLVCIGCVVCWLCLGLLGGCAVRFSCAGFLFLVYVLYAGAVECWSVLLLVV